VSPAFRHSRASNNLKTSLNSSTHTHPPTHPPTHPTNQTLSKTTIAPQLCPGSKAAQYVKCAAAAGPAQCAAIGGCGWSEATALTDNKLNYVIGACGGGGGGLCTKHGLGWTQLDSSPHPHLLQLQSATPSAATCLFCKHNSTTQPHHT